MIFLNTINGKLVEFGSMYSNSRCVSFWVDEMNTYFLGYEEFATRFEFIGFL